MEAMGVTVAMEVKADMVVTVGTEAKALTEATEVTEVTAVTAMVAMEDTVVGEVTVTMIMITVMVTTDTDMDTNQPLPDIPEMPYGNPIFIKSFNS